MAKYKAAGSKSKKTSAKSAAAGRGGFIPCAFILLLMFGAMFALFYYSLK